MHKTSEEISFNNGVENEMNNIEENAPKTSTNNGFRILSIKVPEPVVAKIQQVCKTQNITAEEFGKIALIKALKPEIHSAKLDWYDLKEDSCDTKDDLMEQLKKVYIKCLLKNTPNNVDTEDNDENPEGDKNSSKKDKDGEEIASHKS
ncbi:MAG: hypothetical protein MJ250_06300 [Alphaproteobacteria bacterium]|nr:hypothetical protein [Alphaproteobacteria bacterium]